MASPKTEQRRAEEWVDGLRIWNQNRAEPRETRPRDRSLRGKARRTARRANRQEATRGN